MMTGLTILYGVRELLNNAIPELDFDEYLVELGNENNNDHDMMAEKGGVKLIGEAFNVAASFFHGKKSTSMKKMRENLQDDTKILLMYNEDAVKEGYLPKTIKNEFHLRVKIEI